ncbi:hypothetical protein [Mesorhizobium sp. M0578]|uniref:hypothetical protein n=1 Tax=unclassified Mesorhizobium TaxID=325217 RepID=UPI00333C194C
MELVKYDAACRAVSQARTIDEVKEITNRAEAMRAYARQAKNRTLEIDAVEIRVRAERRLGEILIVLRSDGQIGQGRGGRPIRLKDIGVDSNISGAAQRLAKLPTDRFEHEMAGWRGNAETSLRLEMPLQRYRVPTAKSDHQKAAVRLGRDRINANDPLDRFRSMDGRRIADWRAGELERLKQLAERIIACVDTLTASLPIANADPLDTMEMIFPSRDLGELLAALFDGSKISCGNTGVDGERIKASRLARVRKCETCGSEFVMRALSGKGRTGQSKEGRFCSRECVHGRSVKSH